MRLCEWIGIDPFIPTAGEMRTCKHKCKALDQDELMCLSFWAFHVCI